MPVCVDMLPLHLHLTHPPGNWRMPQRNFLCLMMAYISQELAKDGNTASLGLDLRVQRGLEERKTEPHTEQFPL